MLISQKKEPVIREMQDKTKEFETDKLAFIKSPVIAEFLGFSPDSSFQESELERAIIGNMEKFLMELGKGYALVARQQHIRTAENDYYIDLVFYNYLIKSFILIDLKADKISYQDVGQMDMYLQIYDQMKKGPDDNPTIGIKWVYIKNKEGRQNFLPPLTAMRKITIKNDSAVALLPSHRRGPGSLNEKLLSTAKVRTPFEIASVRAEKFESTHNFFFAFGVSASVRHR